MKVIGSNPIEGIIKFEPFCYILNNNEYHKKVKLMKICEYCTKLHSGVYGSGRFCNQDCARGFSTKEKRQEINSKVSQKLALRPRKLQEPSLKTYVFVSETETPIWKRHGVIWNVPKDTLTTFVNSSKSLTQVLRHIGLGGSGNSYRTLKKRLFAENITFSHFGCTNTPKQQQRSFEDILVVNSTYECTSRLKRRLIKAGLLQEQCNICKCLPLWNGLHLCLELDHINGCRTDNRLENLRILCPNCHSQTSTFSRGHKHVY